MAREGAGEDRSIQDATIAGSRSDTTRMTSRIRLALRHAYRKCAGCEEIRRTFAHQKKGVRGVR